MFGSCAGRLMGQRIGVCGPMLILIHTTYPRKLRAEAVAPILLSTTRPSWTELATPTGVTSIGSSPCAAELANYYVLFCTFVAR